MAARPSIPGIRMSISTMSGSCSATACATSLPSAASPTITMSSTPASSIDSPARTSASSSTTRTRICSLTSATAARRAAGSRRASSSPCTRLPPESVARSARPTRPVPGPGDLRLAGGQDRCRVAHLDRQTLPRGALDKEVHRGRGGVLARVGQRLLDDPQRVATDRVRDGGQVRETDFGVEEHPGGA